MNKGYRIRFVSDKAQNIHNPGESDFLMHYGIKGQRWGVRRFQNEDGTLTEEGRNRYMLPTDANHGRKMSLVGRVKFGKDVTKKTEADEEKRAKASIAEQKQKEEQADEDAFNDFRKTAKNGNLKKWIRNALNEGSERNSFDKAYDHILKKGEKALDKWWDERETVRGDENAWNSLQTKYAKSLAKELNLPSDGETLAWLSDWFFTGDD